MLKQTVTYNDYNDNEKTVDLYFHLTRTELFDQLARKEELEELEARITSNPEKEMPVEDVLALVSVIKRFVALSYGERSADGEHFVKNEEVLQKFFSSAVYDEFFYSLFSDPTKATAFLKGIVPRELRDSLDKGENSPGGESAQTEQPQPTYEELKAQLARVQQNS